MLKLILLTLLSLYSCVDFLDFIHLYKIDNKVYVGDQGKSVTISADKFKIEMIRKVPQMTFYVTYTWEGRSYGANAFVRNILT
jgi:hypothetical protein